MARTIRLISKVLARVPQQRCYWKARWRDPWVPVPALWCDFSEWSAAPSMPVAGFRWQYGIKLDPGALQFGPRFRQNNRLRYFMKVVYSIYPPGEFNQASSWNWVGVHDIELDDQHGPIFEAIDGGDVVAFATGVSHFTCFGVESLLDCQRIRSSLIGPTSATGPHWVKEGLQFNKAGIDGHVIGNRSTGELVDGGFGFHPRRTGGAKWNSYTIVDYLLRRQTPADESNTAQIPFVLEDTHGVIPDWDEPVLPQQGRTTRELLNSLISRQRVRGHYFDVVAPDGGGIEQVRLRPFSFSENLYHLENPSNAFVPANHDPIIIACERDRGATLSVKRSAADKFDLICVQGAKRTSTATFSFADGTLDIGWPIELEALYEQGASTAADYGALEVDERFIRNETARKADKLRPVYSRFVLPDPFGYVVGDGLGTPDEWLTPKDGDADQFVRIAPQDRQFLPHLALRAGFDYTANNVGLGTIEAHAPGAHHYLEPIVLFRRYDWTEEAPRYRHIESVGISAANEIESVENLEFYTATVSVDHEDGSLWLNVMGEGQQHAIAKSDFTPLADDIEQGYSDFRQMICTLTVAWSERVEQYWPEDIAQGFDAIRTLTIDAGDEYRLDYISPGTVVQLDLATGALQKSTGGYLRDDRKQLSGIARLAYEWYGQTRRVVSLETTTISTEFALGQLVVSLGDPDLVGDVLTDEVRSCITSLRFESPVSISTGSSIVPGPVKLTLQTAYGEMDPLAMGGVRRK